MKKYIIIIAAILFLISCNTNENLVQERGETVGLASFEAIPAFFTEDLDNSYVAFDLEALPEGETIDKAEIEVTYGDKSAILREITLPATNVVITANEIIDALGINAGEVVVGDVFYLYILTTKNGKTTRSTAAMAIPVTCEFDTALSTGTYNFESSDWEISGSVVLEADPANPYKIYINGYPEAEGLTTGNGNRIELNINPNTFNISGPKVVLAADLGEWGMADYTNYAYAPVAGTYSSCDGTYTVVFAITVDQGSFGNNVFVFTRPQ
ncbi:hypothetical protein FACS189429_8760 [Bacteroidia bacterium]|nr:hypothetical protein FACS189429_8760 [Bacteroidia bacterium]